MDHSPDSRWSWVAAEEAGVAEAWKAVERDSVRRQQEFEAFQQFEDYVELETKLAVQGPKSLERIRPHLGQTAIFIPMPYRLALL